MVGVGGGVCVVAPGVGVHGCSRGACVVALGGHAWLFGGHAWLLRGGMRGCSGGVHGCSQGGVWLLPGGGMHGIR